MKAGQAESGSRGRHQATPATPAAKPAAAGADEEKEKGEGKQGAPAGRPFALATPADPSRLQPLQTSLPRLYFGFVPRREVE